MYSNGREFNSVDELREAIFKAWDDMPQEYLCTLFHSMKDCIFETHCPTWWWYSVLKCTLLYEAAAISLTVIQLSFLLQSCLTAPCVSPN